MKLKQNETKKTIFKKSPNQTTSTKNHQHMPPKQLHEISQAQLPCPPIVQSFFFQVNAPAV